MFWECCQLTLKNIFTFKVPLKESMIETTIHCPVHVWTFYVRHIHIRNWFVVVSCGLWMLQWNVGVKTTSGSGSCSELDSSSWALGRSSSDGGTGMVPFAELLFDFGYLVSVTKTYRNLPSWSITDFLAILSQSWNVCTWWLCRTGYWFTR